MISRPLAKVMAAGAASDIQEIVFVGALQRSSGVGEFVEAVEHLSRKGILGDRQVTFLGPAAAVRPRLGQGMAGDEGPRLAASPSA